MSQPEIQTRTIKANGLTFTIDECGEGDSVALLLHGFPESRISWRHQLPMLANLGWRAVAPDLRGFGNTSRPAGREPYRIQHLEADVAALFDALGARRRLLVGHDWGGAIAWCAAAHRVTPLDGLVVMNAPHPTIYKRVSLSSLKQPLKSWYILFFQLPWLPEVSLRANRGRAIARAFTGQVADPSVFDAEAIETYLSNIMRPGAATAMINYYRVNAGMIWDKSYEVSIDAPTLLIWGDRDFALDLSLTQGMEEFAKDLTLMLVPGVSHWVQQEAPDRVNKGLAGWLASKGLASP